MLVSCSRWDFDCAAGGGGRIIIILLCPSSEEIDASEAMYVHSIFNSPDGRTEEKERGN